MPMTASDYLDIADQRLTTGDVHREAGQASADYASAQVSAMQAVAAALIRLAEAVESLRS
jgi:hypothetical protein